jgi:DNA-binding CsgD family transcriptional regulator
MEQTGQSEVAALADRSAARSCFDSITDRQKEVLNLVLQHRTSKEIARALNIAPNTVDQRINAVRDKLGARDRAETARIYAALEQLCGKTTCDLPVIASAAMKRLPEPREGEIDPVFVLNDSAVLTAGGWGDIEQLVIPRARLADSKLWRLVAIVAIAVGVAILATTVLAVMQSLNAML